MRSSAAILLGFALVSCAEMAGQTATTPLTDPSPIDGQPVRATVTRVIDGDSMEVVIDDEPDEVRLIGINAPESDECGGTAARDALAAAVEGKEVMLLGLERDQFGRRLAFVEVDGASVGLEAVRQGLALALTVDHAALAAYAEAEDDAFIDQIGIWALDACGTPTDAIVGIQEIEWDPSGPDGDNLNGEYVTLTGLVEDMTGWSLRDESARWRYEFPIGFALADEVTVFTGCGTDGATRLYWCATDPVWSNAGDTVILLDPSGNVVARVSYGAKQRR